MTRGRLIFAFLAEFARLDRAALAREGGLDPDFREPRVAATAPDAVGARGRRELPVVRVPCQVEPERIEEQRVVSAGNSPRSRMELVVHFADLERLGLVDRATGVTLLAPSDRLVALHDYRGALVQRFRDPPGLYVTEVRPIGFGLGMARPRRNLALVVLEARDAAARR